MFPVGKSPTEYCDPLHQYRAPKILSKRTPGVIHEQETNPQANKKYTNEFKSEAIKLAERLSVAEAAEKLGA